MLWVVKFSAKGEVEWEQTYGDYGEEEANAIDNTDDGGYVITGYNKTKGNKNGLVWTLKLDRTGKVLWESAYGGDRGGGIPTDVGNAIISTPTGYTIAAHTRSFGAGDEDMWVLKLNKQGDTLWTETYGGKKEDKALGIINTDNGCIVAGYTESKGVGSEDVWLAGIDGNGSLVWDQTYGGHSNDMANTLAPLENGGYALGGFTHSKGPEKSGSWIIGIDKDHQLQWETTFEGYDGNDKILCLVPNP